MIKQQIEEYFEAHRGELIEDTKALVNIKSVDEEAVGDMPFGVGPKKALDAALDMARKYGFTEVSNVDNYVGVVDYGEGEAKLGILAHLDVVPEGLGWTECEPYNCIEKDGKLYGRGTSDDKGPAVASLLALRCIKDLGIPMKSKVRLILGTSEETSGGDIEYYFDKHPAPPMVFSPDGEYPILNIEKGQLRPVISASYAEDSALPRIAAINGGTVLNAVPPIATAIVEGMDAKTAGTYFEKAQAATGATFDAEDANGGVKLTAHGANAHASTPAAGLNAITAMISLLGILPIAKSEGYEKLMALNSVMPHGETDGKSLGIACSDDISGALSISLDIFDYTTTGFSAKLDSRVPICGGEERLYGILSGICEKVGLTTVLALHEAPHHTDENSDFVRELKKVYGDYTGLEAKCVYMGGGTYVHNIDGGVAFGCVFPGDDTHMHGPDEFVRIDDLMISGKMFAQVIADLCGE